MGSEKSNGIDVANVISGTTDIGHIAFDASLKSNVYEDGNLFVIQVEIPNAAYEDIKIEIEDSRVIVLTVNFKNINSCNNRNSNRIYHLREIKEKGLLKRTFIAPFNLDVMKCKTTCQDGFFEIVIEK
jgi:HSP20 family molecular chaperone IbpA